MKFFNGKKNRYRGHIGLDIGVNEINAVQLGDNPTTNKLDILGWSKQSLNKGCLIKGEVRRPQDLKNSIQNLLLHPNAGEFAGDDVVVVLSEDICDHHQFSLNDHVHTAFIDDYVSQMNELPFDTAVVDWDYKVYTKGADTPLLYACAIDKYLLQDYRRILKNLGMSPIFESRAIAGSRLFLDHNQSSEVLYIDIGAHEVSLATINRHGVIQSSTVETGYEDLVSVIARKFQLDLYKAKQVLFMRQPPEDVRIILEQIVGESLSKIIKDAHQHITFYNYRTKSDLQKILLSGAGSAIINIGSLIEQDLEMTVLPFKLAREFNVNIEIPGATHYSSAIGAAIRGVNLAKDLDHGIRIR